MADYVSHLAADFDHELTACGEPWQGWQAPTSYVGTGDTLPPHTNPDKENNDIVRVCGACLTYTMGRLWSSVTDNPSVSPEGQGSEEDETMSQINTTSPDGEQRLCIQADRDGNQVMLGMQTAEKVSTNPDEPHSFDELSGMWMPLDRAGCNNIIRSVRTMRDRAFGKDE